VFTRFSGRTDLVTHRRTNPITENVFATVFNGDGGIKRFKKYVVVTAHACVVSNSCVEYRMRAVISICFKPWLHVKCNLVHSLQRSQDLLAALGGQLLVQRERVGKKREGMEEKRRLW